MLGYSVQEANTIGMHDVTAWCEFIVFMKDLMGNIWYSDRLYMMYLVADCFALQRWHIGSIYVISHPDIFLQNWDIFRMLLYTVCRISFIGWTVMFCNRLTRSVHQGRCIVSSFLHLRYGGA